MKQVSLCLFTAIMCITLLACKNDKNTDDVEIDYGDSNKFSKTEIESAIDFVLIEFSKDYEGCEMLKIWYDEKMSDESIQRDISSVGGNTIKSSGAEPINIIVLFSDFYASDSAGVGFEKDCTYTNWRWLLIRDSLDDEWEFGDSGY